MEGKTDFTKLNQDHFDNEAAHYDAKHEKTTEEIARRIETRRDFIGVDWIEDDDSSEDENGDDTHRQPHRTVKVLDYACGTGSMSRFLIGLVLCPGQALAPYITQSIGIDLSEKMVAAYNVRAQNQGLTEDEMAAFHGNLCVPGDESPGAFRDPKFFDFDLAVVGLGFHHFDDPELAAKRLVARLRPGGVLMIIDFLPHGPHGSDSSESHGHEHHNHHHHHHHHPHDHSHHGHHHHEEHGQIEVEGGDASIGKALKTVTHHGFSEEHIKEIFVDAGAGKDFAIDNMGQVVFGPRHGKRTLFMARGTKA
ncbi:hypothetical protein VM1G_08107 [Cytospora mali]|uniref:Uncharacterized protein n=1 Tax=Cytospora mali TaxID=578113 RepID=A0A194W9E5_CYTMA|nr:hypothetical protein VM1G_08107 [Valsa mali]